ncbi:MAG: hypothetical protein P4L84_37260 [Isosphaeraceae bacterium]|nr:hypothetical protein [Isosphaeraceae bacterium]
MITIVFGLLLTSQLPYGDYIGDPEPRRAANRDAAEPSPKPAPLPAPPPSPSPRREAGRRVSPGELGAKQWYALTSHPGYEGYGARNERGEVVVEWHRRVGANELVPGPAPALPFGAPSCPNGQCAAPTYTYRRGFFGTR